MAVEGMEKLVEMSNRYGSDSAYVLAGGGNTSVKEDDVMYVKASGTSLATIKAEGFVAMDQEELLAMFEAEYPKEDDAREAEALADMMTARLPGEESKRPSVECLLHAAIPYKYVLHTHPALVNGLTCSVDGEKVCKELLGEDVLWIPLTKPGYILGKVAYDEFEAWSKEHDTVPHIMMLQNHGIFVSADTVEEVDALMKKVMDKLGAVANKTLDESETTFDKNAVTTLAPALRMLYDQSGKSVALFHTSKGIVEFTEDEALKEIISQPFTPDHIVYCKDQPLFLTGTEDSKALAEAFGAYVEKNGYAPKIVMVEGLGYFALGNTYKEASTAKEVWVDALKIAVFAEQFGGTLTLPRDFTEFILNWEIESYRQKVAHGAGGLGAKRVDGKIAIVTGAAQGFGEGIARDLAAQGAYVAIADLNLEGATALTKELNDTHGAGTAIAIQVDVGEDVSVEKMVEDTVLFWGGLDIMVSNAGIAIAGDLTEMDKKRFELVTKVNYTGYFLCTKYSTVPMKIQREFSPNYMMDVVEVNSKSGLVGSNKNFAYAGSKFGGIGLTQSFALELVEYGIKVNAVCPGNLLDGPLWSDPENGLFRQYFEAGKVPGAKTVEDVRHHYESLVPIGRGCTTEDVSLAIMYLVEQKYETGQALPVTGGQVMLK